MASEPMPPKYRVFLSHGGGDKYVAKRVMAPQMEQAGASVFLDLVEVSYGANFRDQIFRELEQSHELCILFTPTSVLRPWVFAELGAAIARGLLIVAVVYGVSEQELQAKGILSLLGTNNYLLMDDLDSYLEQLRHRVKGL